MMQCKSSIRAKAYGCSKPLTAMGIRHPKHGRVDLTGPMRADRVARVRAGFGRAALSNPNGATSRTARRAPPRRPGPSVAAPLFVGWDGIGPVRRSRASDGRSSRGKVEAAEDCRSRLIVQDECDEIQAATALTGQCVDVMHALQELGPVNTCRWFTKGGRRDIPGSDGSHAMRGRVTASASEDGQGGRFHDSCDRDRRGSCGTVRGAAAVFVSLMATRQPERNDLLSPRRVRREHTVEPDQGVARRRDQRCQLGEELQWRHYAVRLVAPWFADCVCDAAVVQHAEPLKAERGPGAITKEPFAAVAVRG